MQKCLFCGTEWEGSGPCPNCGVDPKTPRDDTMFRPPKGRANASQEAPPEFEVEKLMRWEPSSKPEEPEEDAPKEEEKAPVLEKSEEGSLRPRKCFKQWQKLTAAVVAVAVVATAVAVKLWPQPQALPPEPAFFVQDGTLMALPMGGEPQKLGVYYQGMEESLAVSPDSQSIAWVENGISKIMLPEKRVVSFSTTSAYAPRFSMDGRFLYCIVWEENESVLYQMDISSKQERRVSPVGYDSYWENGSLLVIQGDGQLTIYNVDTLEEMDTLEIEGMVVSLFENRMYYIENMADAANGMQLCCWQNGETMVALENISSCSLNANGSAYMECYQKEGEPVSVAELMKNDMGAEGEDFLKSLEGKTIPSPNRCLYYFTGSALRPMGENLTLLLSPQTISQRTENERMMFSSPGYVSVEKLKGTYSLLELYELVMDVPDLSFAAYITGQWPQENPVNFMAVEEKLFRLPENSLPTPIDFRSTGNWTCLYQMGGQELAVPTLWVGKLEGDHVSYQDSYSLPETGVTDFIITPEGDLYYWEGQYTASLYANGVKISDEVVPESIQYTHDGAVYFLEGIYSDKLMLCRVYGGKREELARNIADYIPYTRDYAVCLQNREDGSYDLLVCMDEKQSVLAAEQVEMLLPALSQPSQVEQGLQ